MSNTKKRYNFSTISEEFLLYAKERHKKQGFQTLERNFRLHIFPYFENYNVEDIRKTDIMNWQTEILKKNFRNNFNKNLLSCFSTFMQYCVNRSYARENVVSLVGKFPKKIEKKNYDVYTIWEFRKFRHYLKNLPIKQFFNFMYFYGTRPSETMALKFSDIDGLYCNIEHTIHRRGKRELDTPKNQSSIRTIKISILMWLRIYKLKRFYKNKYSSFDREYFIFGGQKPLASTTIDRHKEKACNKAKMRIITQHQFRHSCATRLVHKKIPIDNVSRLLGHSRVSTTVDVYLHQVKRMPKHSRFRINF